jgi:hypothetical protein
VRIGGATPACAGDDSHAGTDTGSSPSDENVAGTLAASCTPEGCSSARSAAPRRCPRLERASRGREQGSSGKSKKSVRMTVGYRVETADLEPAFGSHRDAALDDEDQRSGRQCRAAIPDGRRALSTALAGCRSSSAAAAPGSPPRREHARPHEARRVQPTHGRCGSHRRGGGAQFCAQPHAPRGRRAARRPPDLFQSPGWSVVIAPAEVSLCRGP